LKGFCVSVPNSNLSASPWGKTLLHEKALYLGKMALLSNELTTGDSRIQRKLERRSVRAFKVMKPGFVQYVLPLFFNLLS
jgi:hypothetical protein